MLKEISQLKGVGPKRLEAFASMGITDGKDLLGAYPVSYQDRTNIRKIGELKAGDECLIEAVIARAARWYASRTRSSVVDLTAVDDSGEIKLRFFSRPYIAGYARDGFTYKIYGKVTETRGKRLEMVQPDIARASDSDQEGILPFYRLPKGLSQKVMRNAVREMLDSLDESYETLPEGLLEKRHMAGCAFAVRNIHFPSSREAYAAARFRIVYEEMFLFAAGLGILSGRMEETAPVTTGIAFPHDDYTGEFQRSLGYELTDAQKRAVKEIEDDMESASQMQRLLQGDVGSGKTAVAASVLYKAAKDGCQGALMAPTELLASQHYEKFRKLFEPLGVRVGFLSGSQKLAEKREMKRLIADGRIDIVIGTHAVIQDDVEFSNLGLVITDEQHRFGVNQRVSLASKGASPDVLVMTATPIPRSLAVVIFAGMPVSILDELPAGRKPIITETFSKAERGRAYEKLGQAAAEGRQAYVVAPLVSDSEFIDAHSAESLAAEMSSKFPGVKVGLLHGAMKAAEKDAVMQDFAAGKIQILVSTVVIEVGIDVPNATIMLIENAERFGLAQMHQLRGRVGRGSQQSYCYLIVENDSGLGAERAQVLASTSDGFEIAERDLEMRGPGEFFGTRQHGIPELRIANPAKHGRILQMASEDAEALLREDPSLSDPQNAGVKAAVEKLYGRVPEENIGI